MNTCTHKPTQEIYIHIMLSTWATTVCSGMWVGGLLFGWVGRWIGEWGGWVGGWTDGRNGQADVWIGG